MTKKVQIGFDERSLKVIEALKKASGAATTADVIRDALGFYDWARRQVEDGAAIVTMKKGKPVREVMLRFMPDPKVSNNDDESQDPVDQVQID